MKPIETLMTEHRVIEQVLACLEKMSHQSMCNGKLNIADARDALDFFRNFADRCHHGKEEDRLFPLLEDIGLPRENGPTAVMRLEHEEGREFIRAMSEALDAMEQGDDGARPQFTVNASNYVAMLRVHIRKEDHCLFAMAKQAMSDAHEEQLAREFATFEVEDMEKGTHERYLAVANRLADTYGVDRAAHAPGVHVA